jgi:hypothetical protein
MNLDVILPKIFASNKIDSCFGSHEFRHIFILFFKKRGEKGKTNFLRKNILILEIKAFSDGFDFKIWSFVHLSREDVKSNFLKKKFSYLKNLFFQVRKSMIFFI